MKKLLILFLTLIAADLSTQAYTVLDTSTGQICESPSIPSLKRTVEKLANGTKVTYEFEKVLVTPDPLVSGAYMLTLDQFGSTATETEALLPLRIDRFMITNQYAAEISILEDDYIDVTMEISPARSLHLANEDFVYTTENLPQIALSNDFSPQNCVEHLDYQTYRDDVFKSVLVSPIQYRSSNKTTRIHKKLSFMIDETNTIAPDSDNPRRINNDPFYNAITVNENSQLQMPPSPRVSVEDPISYLILAPEKLKEAALEFYYWKMNWGFNVQLIIKQTWTTATIKETVREFYDNDPHAYYLLIIGDTSHMPTCSVNSGINSSSNVFSDMPYACMDGDDDIIADLKYGRIPASNNEEVLNVINKNRSYFTHDKGKGMPTTFMGAAYFQDGSSSNSNKDGYEDYYYARTVETVCQQLDDTFDSIKRIYTTNSPNPKNWNRGTIGFDFPDYLKEYSAWTGNTTDIINTINSGCNVVLHRDHGEISGWYKPSFQTRDLSLLTNEIYPIVFSINCESGDFTYSTNFARRLLCQKIGGAAAVIASTAVSYNPMNDVLA